MRKYQGNIQMKDEIWKNIDGYKGLYQVSNLGRIKRIGAKIKIVDMVHNRIYYTFSFLIVHIHQCNKNRLLH